MYFNNKKRLDKIKDNTPNLLKEISQWGYYHIFYDREKGKKYKRIFSANENIKYLNVSDRTSFSSFKKALEKAYKVNASGLSIVLLKENNITCVDLDNHFDNERGKWSKLSKRLVTSSNNTFIEKSFSKKGLHIFTKGIFLDDSYRVKNNENDIEVYSDKKIISLTADLISCDYSDLKTSTNEYENLVKESIGKRKIYTKKTVNNYDYLSTNEVIANIQKSKSSTKFNALFAGVWSDYTSQSEADFALMSIAAFFARGDQNVVEKIFEMSGLYRAKKGRLYVQNSVKNACSNISKYYADDAEDMRRIARENYISKAKKASRERE